MWRPNGPAAGTCVGGPREGLDCTSDVSCGVGGRCHQSQEDIDGDFIGDACLVPEPGFLSLLAGGVVGLAGGARVRRKHA